MSKHPSQLPHLIHGAPPCRLAHAAAAVIVPVVVCTAQHRLPTMSKHPSQLPHPIQGAPLLWQR